MAERNPDAIQREIEQTRAELAETIDAIADKISPKRAAGRSAAAVKATVSSVLQRDGGSGPGSSHVPGAVIDAPPQTAAHVDNESRVSAIRAVAASGGGTAYTGSSEYTVGRSLRTDRLLLTLGAVAALAGVIVLVRSRD